MGAPATECRLRLEAVFQEPENRGADCARAHGRAARALVQALARLPSGRIDAHTTVDIATRAPGSLAGLQMTGWTLIADVRSSGDARAHSVAATLIDRVHEAANLPECECDADVSVQAGQPDPHAGPPWATPSGAPTVT